MVDEKVQNERILQIAFDSVVEHAELARFVGKFIAQRRVFLVAGSSSYAASGAERLLQPLLGESVRFSGFSPNPKLTELRQALQAFRENGTECIVAVGGGSALDLAKLVNYFVTTGLTPEEWLAGARSERCDFLPLLAVPTTAGSGSEVTRFAVLYAAGEKFSVAADGLTPSHLILNPEFLTSLSTFQRAVTGYDALSHALESMWARAATEESRKISRAALAAILRWLPQHVERPDSDTRREMLLAACTAGRAIDMTRTTLAHALSYSLTIHEKTAHGEAVAVFLPLVARYNLSEMVALGGSDAEIARGIMDVFGVTTPDGVGRQLEQLSLQTGLPLPLLAGDARAVELLERALREVNLERLGNNPVEVDGAVLQRMLGGSEY